MIPVFSEITLCRWVNSASLVSVCLLGLVKPEHEGTTTLQNVGICLTVDKV
jgi:hypothetical protein